jgi:hypothetical protein
MSARHTWMSCTLMLVAMTFASSRARAGYILTREAPGVQTSQVAGVVTESFDSFTSASSYTTLNTAVGTFTAPGLAVVAANQYGGAGGSGKFIGIGNWSGTTEATLTLDGAQAYFGFWWSAADPLNKIEFYSGATLVAFFDPVTALGDLTNPAYFGNPTPTYVGQNAVERYAYLNFIGTEGSTFDRVVFRNIPPETGFEADNFSVRTSPVTITPGLVISGGVKTVPAPAGLVLASSAVGAYLLVRRCQARCSRRRG